LHQQLQRPASCGVVYGEVWMQVWLGGEWGCTAVCCFVVGLSLMFLST
jgi:hypothetical protein